MWIGIIILIGVIALVLRWTLRRARTQEDTRADDDRRVQLKRATEHAQHGAFVEARREAFHGAWS